MTTQQMTIKIPSHIDFAELGLWRKDDVTKFTWSVLHELAAYNNIDPALLTEDNVASLIIAWYHAHLTHGGDKVLAAESLIAETINAVKKEIFISKHLPIDPPPADVIKAIRAQVGTQKLCANLLGISLNTWQYYESGDRKPHAAMWGMFLLATGQHPMYSIVTK